MMKLLSYSLVATLLLAPTVHAQSIGIFLDEDGTRCAAEVGSAPYISLHVLAIPGGALPEVHGVQFRISGVPESWTSEKILWIPDPTASLSLGHPLFPHPVV